MVLTNEQLVALGCHSFTPSTSVGFRYGIESLGNIHDCLSRVENASGGRLIR